MTGRVVNKCVKSSKNCLLSPQSGEWMHTEEKAFGLGSAIQACRTELYLAWVQATVLSHSPGKQCQCFVYQWF